MSFKIDLKKEKYPVDPNHELPQEIKEYFKKNNLIPSLQENIYPPFKKWLNSKKEVTLRRVLIDIHDNLFPLLEYDKTEDWLNSEVEVKRNKIIFKGFYKHNDFSINTGDCGELAHKLTLLVKEKYPALNIVISNGQDDKFFSGNGANHVFPLVYINNFDDKELKRYYLDYNLPSTNSTNNIPGNVYIVDPTYRDIKDLKTSEYNSNRSISLIRSKNNQDNHMINSSRPAIVDKNNNTILLVDADHEKGILKYFKKKKELSHYIALYYKNINSKKSLKINEISELENKFEDPKIIDFIKKFIKRIENYEN